MTARRLTSRVAILVLALVLLGAAVCGDDDDSSDSGGSKKDEKTAETSKDTGDTSGTSDTTEKDSSPESGTDTTSAVDSDLAASLPKIDGYVSEMGEEEMSIDRCDGGAYSIRPVSQANATYQPEDSDDTSTRVLIATLGFDSADDASSFYDETTDSFDQCVSEGQSAGDPRTVDLGDEALILPIEEDGKTKTVFLIARRGEQVWLVAGPPRGDDLVDSDILDSLKNAVES